MEDTDSTELFTLDGAAIANFVWVQRRLFGWKKQMLASQAGVSLSTVERVERGLRVRPTQLRKIAAALGQKEDEFLRPRTRPSPEEAAANFVDIFSWMEGRVPVQVAPFRTEPQLRVLLDTHSMLFETELGPAATGDLAEFREWLELAAFVELERRGIIRPKPGRGFRVRNLWRDVLAAALRIERTHAAVILTGVYEAQSTHGGDPVRIGICAVRSRRRNPAAGQIKTLWADGQVDERAILADYFGAEE